MPLRSLLNLVRVMWNARHAVVWLSQMSGVSLPLQGRMLYPLAQPKCGYRLMIKNTIVGIYL